MSPKPDVSEERKNQILDAAMTVFLNRGFDKARMDDIVEEAGISKGGVYWYFKSKDQIISGVFDRLVAREFERFTNNQNQFYNATEKLFFLVTLFENDLKQLNAFMPILFDMYAWGLRHNSVRKMVSISMQRYMDVVIPVIEEGISNGEFRMCDAKEAAITLGSIIEGTILLKAYQPDTIDLQKHIRSGVRIFIEGIKAV